MDQSVVKRKIALRDNPKVLEHISTFLEETKYLLHDTDSDEALEYVDWVKTKANLKFHKEIDEKLVIVANCLYWAELGSNVGSEQGLYRPVLVVNTSRNSPICTIIPLTLERLNDKYDFHIDLDNGSSTALVEHMRVVSKKRIVEPLREKGKIESISKGDWNKINFVLEQRYRLKPLRNN